jgi:acetyltransferase-like isoleucine patch superfamily enzyme
MVYGYYCRRGRKFRKHTRISSTAKLIGKEKIDLGDHVWIGHYALVDGTGGVTIGEGVQISSHSIVYSHSSQDAIRLLGRHYIEVPAKQRPGYKLKPVTIGAYTFLGTSSVILPGTQIGSGCIIGAGAVVSGVIPDYAIVQGNPGEITGDTRNRDHKMFHDQLNPETYYNKEVYDQLSEQAKKRAK